MEKQGNRLIVASHQPHFFPWLGYLDKMAKADLFLINDLAKGEKKSPMTRNKILGRDGAEVYISVSIISQNIMAIQNREIQLSQWAESMERVKGQLIAAYKKTTPFFDEIWEGLRPVFEAPSQTLLDVDLKTIHALRALYGIETPMRLQSTLDFASQDTPSRNIVVKCKAVHATGYLSGNGGRKYMDLDDFTRENIEVQYQQFTYPVYDQHQNRPFVPNLCSLDLLFHCGIEEGRRIFWKNVRSTHEFNGKERL